MNSQTIIGLTGKAHAGKDTAALALTKKGFCSYSFAFPIKKVICELFNITFQQINDPVFKNTPLPNINRTPRYLMQTLGTEWGREYVDPELWVKLAEDKIQRHRKVSNAPIVFTDIRFNDEAQMLRRYNATIVEIKRPENPFEPKKTPIDPDPHKSEEGINFELIDTTVLNITTIQQLQDKMLDVLRRLKYTYP